MAKKVTSQVEVEQIRGNLVTVHEHMGLLLQKLADDHKDLRICAGYPDFQKDSPNAYYERASAKLNRKDYKVAFAGPFKAGKSTFLSALLKQPGMLPAEDAECTFSVGVIAAPGPGENERVEITYYTPDEALGNLLKHMRYVKLFEWDTGRQQALMKDLREQEVLSYLAESGNRARGTDKGEEADEILGFIEAYKKYGDRLGRNHIDTIANLPTYVRKEEGIGHLLLIKIVHIFMNNPVLAKQGIHIADTPGTDSMNEAAREITFGYLKEADAVVYLAEARGLSTNFNLIREELSKYHNSIREKMFIVANKADWYEVKSMAKEGGDKAPIEVVYEGIVNPLRALNLDENKLFFTCGRIAELEQKRSSNTIMPDEEKQYATMRQALDDKLKALSPEINPLLLQKLQICFKDGGIDEFRQVLIDYLDIDIQVERLKEIYLDLARVYQGAMMLLEPERDRLQNAMANMKTQGMMVTEFFDKVRETFSDTASSISRAIETVSSNITEKVKAQIQTTFTSAIDRFNIERIRVRMPVQVPVKIKIEVIENLKGLLAERFIQVMRESFAPVIKTKLHQQLAQTKVQELIKSVAAQTNSQHSFELQYILEEFDRTVDQFTSLRASEEAWELQRSEIKPGGYEAQWTPQVEEKFREQLKKLFVNKFANYVTKVGSVIGRHYQALLADLVGRFDRLVEELARDVKKDPDRVKLPTDLLGTDVGETDEERKARALVTYFKHMEAVEEPYSIASGYLQ